SSPRDPAELPGTGATRADPGRAAQPAATRSEPSRAAPEPPPLLAQPAPMSRPTLMSRPIDHLSTRSRMPAALSTAGIWNAGTFEISRQLSPRRYGTIEAGRRPDPEVPHAGPVPTPAFPDSGKSRTDLDLAPPSPPDWAPCRGCSRPPTARSRDGG